jgi:hypothetical protein
MYDSKIKTLEESFRLVEAQINQLQQSNSGDSEKLQKLLETKNKYLLELRELRRKQYEYSQTVDFGDDR